MRKILIPVQGEYVAQRFDLATEIIIALVKDGEILEEPRELLMEKPSEEELCNVVISENITDLVCGGIDESHYNFFVWKKVQVFDGVICDWRSAITKTLDGSIASKGIYVTKWQ